MIIDGNSVAAAERLSAAEEQARRAGARAGLLGEATPEGFERWQGRAQAAFSESYARGRLCRRVAERNERGPASVPSMPAHATTREQLAAEFARRPDFQREFCSADTFVAFAIAGRGGKARILRRPAASSVA